MIRLRNMAAWARLPMEFDLTQLAAVAEDELVEAIIANDPMVVGSEG